MDSEARNKSNCNARRRLLHPNPLQAKLLEGLTPPAMRAASRSWRCNQANDGVESPLHHSDAGPASPAGRPDACGGGVVLEARQRGHGVFHQTLGKILLLKVVVWVFDVLMIQFTVQHENHSCQIPH